ncbi:hypothetical protein AALP_AA6G030000 [Arabis alpina]|uniref:Uncharacterized protein n=1 Tax=Arabis alpina TaxID=50452 RepID=A0A087GLR5_ARAAL|nr:hypothetical protein AALP_AA6G030000 [Arabis alpina]
MDRFVMCGGGVGVTVGSSGCYISSIIPSICDHERLFPSHNLSSLPAKSTRDRFSMFISPCAMDSSLREDSSGKTLCFVQNVSVKAATDDLVCLRDVGLARYSEHEIQNMKPHSFLAVLRKPDYHVTLPNIIFQRAELFLKT